MKKLLVQLRSLLIECFTRFRQIEGNEGVRTKSKTKAAADLGSKENNNDSTIV